MPIIVPLDIDCRRSEHSCSGYGWQMEAPDTTTSAAKSLVPTLGPFRPASRLDETIASVDADSVPDPAAGRNVDQHRALRDD